MILINTYHHTWVRTTIPDVDAYNLMRCLAQDGDRAARRRLRRIRTTLCPSYDSGCACGVIRGPSSPAGYEGTGQAWLDRQLA